MTVGTDVCVSVPDMDYKPCFISETVNCGETMYLHIIEIVMTMFRKMDSYKINTEKSMSPYVSNKKTHIFLCGTWEMYLKGLYYYNLYVFITTTS